MLTVTLEVITETTIKTGIRSLKKGNLVGSPGRSIWMRKFRRRGMLTVTLDVITETKYKTGIRS